jgi:hypothetical protein
MARDYTLVANRTKTTGIHFAGAVAIAEYIEAARIDSSPLFASPCSRSDELAARRTTQRVMYEILTGNLERLPGLKG